MSIRNQKFILIALVYLVFCAIESLPVSINTNITDIETGIYYKFRGSRPVSDDIFVVYIGDEDVSALNGWPFTRDYYSYAIHALRSAGAKTIAIDLLFLGEDSRYVQYDHTLADFISSSANICLPMMFSELNTDSAKTGLLRGVNPQFPFDPLPELAAGNGFSNFSLSSTINRTPLLVKTGEDTIFSFALEASRLFLDVRETKYESDKGISFDSKRTIPVNHKGELWINYFTESHLKNSISFVNLLQTFRNQPDSLDLQDKLVIVITTASGVAQLKTTPAGDAIPGSLIHINVIDNILQKNWLEEPTGPAKWLILLFFTILILILSSLKNKLIKTISIYSTLLIYFVIVVVIFTTTSYVLPLFYPIFLSLIMLIVQARSQRRLHAQQNEILAEQLLSKERNLEVSRQELKVMQEKLQQESTRSDESVKQISDQQSMIDQLEKELGDLRSYTNPQSRQIVSKSQNLIFSDKGKMSRVVEMIHKVSGDNIPVLITGETGTGKEMIAREIHNHSPRSEAPFVPINCGALSESLLESELFGHKKGSFTGAISDRKGRFELADGGTIFLDEITETTPVFQTKLLRVLQEGTFEPVGSETTIHIDTRIIAATNKDINEIVKAERFRPDLFYRLNGFMINVPPLRERTDDIPLLTEFFLNKHEYQTIEGVSEHAMELLQSYSWPGNVRELENTIRRSAILAASEKRTMIQQHDLANEIHNQSSRVNIRSIHQPLEEQIISSLRDFKFSRSAITQTAKILGDRDRGTITEYFRGICFEALANSDYNISEAAKTITNNDDPDINLHVITKINSYIENIRPYTSQIVDLSQPLDKLPAPFRGLPKKYHPVLNLVLQHIDQLS